ncbi:MAG: DUF3168 domain-containing protein [Bacillota bacterium]
MVIEEALYAYLSSHVGLTALVGSRIYPLVMPQGTTLPAVTFSKVSGPRVHAMQHDAGLAYPRFQVSCWGSTYKQAKEVAAQVRAALQDFKGTMGGPGGAEVSGVFLEDETDLYEPNTQIYHVALDFIIWHNEAVTVI